MPQSGDDPYRQEASRSSVPARRASRLPSSSRRAGHDVHVYERESRAGGLLRYGIPDFKMEKNFIDRRVEQMKGENVTFHCGVNVGVDVTVEKLRADYDAVLYCGGSETPREAGIPGVESPRRALMPCPISIQQNRRVGRENDRQRRLAGRSDPRPAASMSSSSAVVIRRPTASARPSARVPSR